MYSAVCSISKFFEGAQRLLLVVLGLDFHRSPRVKRNCAPSQRLHTFHRKLEQLIVGQIPWKFFHRQFRRGKRWLGRQMNAPLLHPLFENCEWPVHDVDCGA